MWALNNYAFVLHSCASIAARALRYTASACWLGGGKHFLATSSRRLLEDTIGMNRFSDSSVIGTFSAKQDQCVTRSRTNGYKLDIL